MLQGFFASSTVSVTTSGSSHSRGFYSAREELSQHFESTRNCRTVAREIEGLNRPQQGSPTRNVAIFLPESWYKPRRAEPSGDKTLLAVCVDSKRHQDAPFPSALLQTQILARLATHSDADAETQYRVESRITVMATIDNGTTIQPGDHAAYMRHALLLAALSPPQPTNFRVGAILLDAATNAILATGYTLELPGNTHAEQCCLMKLARAHDIPEERVRELLPDHCVLYTTMEPCGKRLSGNMPCVERILRTKVGGKGIRAVYLGVKEPETFVGENTARAQLEANGIQCIHVPGLEEEILKIATAGHLNESDKGPQ